MRRTRAGLPLGMRKSLVGLLAVMLVGCSGPVIDDPVAEVTPDPEPTEVITVGPVEPVETRTPAPDSEDVVESHEGPIVRASAEAIAPDSEIMAAMECEPLSAETSAFIPAEQRYRVAPVDPVQVLIGEGLEAGELWWVVAFERDGQFEIGGSYATNQAWITTQPGVDGQGKWLNISSNRVLPDGSVGSEWHNVHWDHDRLERGQSALRLALDCLG